MTADKRTLRTEAAATRAALHAGSPMAGETLSAWYPRISGAPGLMAGYWPMRSEIDPRPLMRRFARAGWRLALPVTPGRGAEGGLEFRHWDKGDALARRRFGMFEPGDAAKVVRPDVVLVPLLAFDAAGHRLGYGAGHYDRTLAQLRAEGPLVAIGVAFAGQEVAALPAASHDQRLDAVVTERRYRTF